MMFNFNDNKKTVTEIVRMFKDGQLVVDDSYQRRSVWSEKDRVRLIETILINLVIPELFFWKADTDPETGISTTHIVDGQQRINAICSFIENGFKLKKQYLLDNGVKEKYSNKLFKDLDADTKKAFWNYQLMIIDIDPRASREDIITMFNRLNLTDYNLNDQEKRNSLSGEFASLARELSEIPIWTDENNHFFTKTDIKRMKDVEFCASLILLYKKGIIDQTNQKALNQAYEEMQTGYKEAEEDKLAICQVIEIIPKFVISDDIKKFLQRKAQLYTLFSVVFYMQRSNQKFEEHQKNNFKIFVELYSIFDNNMNLEDKIYDDEKTIFDWLKKYKLASSEGLNKYTNRMIRFNIMKNFIFIKKGNILLAIKTLYDKMKDSLKLT